MTLARRLAALEHAHSKPGEVTRVLFLGDMMGDQPMIENDSIIGAMNPDNGKQIMRNPGEVLAEFRQRAAQALFPGVPGDSLQLLCEAIYREQPLCV